MLSTRPILNALGNHFSTTAAKAQLQAQALQGVKGILEPQVQYAQAQQAQKARLSMAAQAVPDMPYDRPEPKRKKPGVF